MQGMNEGNSIIVLIRGEIRLELDTSPEGIVSCHARVDGEADTDFSNRFRHVQLIGRSAGNVRVKAQRQVVQQFHVILGRNVKRRRVEQQRRNLVERLECGIAELVYEGCERNSILVPWEFLGIFPATTEDKDLVSCHCNNPISLNPRRYYCTRNIISACCRQSSGAGTGLSWGSSCSMRTCYGPWQSLWARTGTDPRHVYSRKSRRQMQGRCRTTTGFWNSGIG